MGPANGQLQVRAAQTIQLPTRRATTQLGRWLGRAARAGDLIILSGDLGAGKTFAARAMARQMGVDRHVRVTSPTFTLVHEFSTTPRLVHADLYRISSATEVDQLLLREARADGAVLVVEWGEPYVHELGGDALVVRLTMAQAHRIAILGYTGPDSLARCQNPLPPALVTCATSKQEG